MRIFAGSLVPIVGFLAWLGFAGASNPFIEIVRNYWPLYAQINGEMEVNAGTSRWRLSWISFGVWAGTDGGFSPRVGSPFWITSGTYSQIRVSFGQPDGLLCLVSRAFGTILPISWLPFVYFIILLYAMSRRNEVADKPCIVARNSIERAHTRHNL